eukprot:8645185-Alexandrium_andersonii.AAC.1
MLAQLGSLHFHPAASGGGGLQGLSVRRVRFRSVHAASSRPWQVQACADDSPMILIGRLNQGLLKGR